MDWSLGLHTDTIAFWWTYVLRILTVDYTFNSHTSSLDWC